MSAGAVRIVHCADLHLDYSFAGGGLAPARAARCTEELKDVLAAIVERTARSGAQLLLIAGDLFEHQRVRKATVRRITELLDSLDGVRVFISPGNHDPLLPDSYYATYPWPANVHIFGPQWQAVALPELGVTVHGYGFGDYYVHEPMLQRLRVGDGAGVHIALVHGSDTAAGGPESEYLPLSAADVAASGADYVALGHYHGARVVLAAGNRLRAAYPGSPQSLDFGEQGGHGIYVGEVGKGGAELSLESVARRRHITARVDLDGAVTPEEVEQRVLAVAPGDERSRDLFRILLSGTLDPELSLNLAALHERLAGEFFALSLSLDAEPGYNLAALSEETSVLGQFVRALLARLDTAADDAERARIRAALNLGLAAFRGEVRLP